jgi:2-dehydrotetronate isomerase
MPRFCANLDWLYLDLPLLDRPNAAARDRFGGVECLRPYLAPAAELARAVRAAKLAVPLINAPAGDWDKGERGLASLPGREAEFAASLDLAFDYARQMGAPLVHVMAGLVPKDVKPETAHATYVANLRLAAAHAARANLRLCIEPINPIDMPGYFLNRQDQAHEIAGDIGAVNLGVQMDFYHCQMSEGGLARKFEGGLARIAHVQIAAVPGRNEPDSGEIAYPFLFELMDRLGYAGWVGCEYKPRGATSDGLGWMAPYTA